MSSRVALPADQAPGFGVLREILSEVREPTPWSRTETGLSSCGGAARLTQSDGEVVAGVQDVHLHHPLLDHRSAQRHSGGVEQVVGADNSGAERERGERVSGGADGFG